jgi:hypothetical protein
VVVQSERLERFWREAGRRWNREATLTVPGSEGLLLTDEEWVILWRGLLAVRCSYFDVEAEYPVYRSVNPKRAEAPGMMWECLANFGLVSTDFGADYYVVGSAEWPKPDQFARVWAKWTDALSIYRRVMSVSKSMPSDVEAAPAFVLSVIERDGSVVIQSHYPLPTVTPRDTLWAALALPAVPDWSPPKTTYLEWDRELVVTEILRAINKDDGNDS